MWLDNLWNIISFIKEWIVIKEPINDLLIKKIIRNTLNNWNLIKDILGQINIECNWNNKFIKEILENLLNIIYYWNVEDINDLNQTNDILFKDNFKNKFKINDSLNIDSITTLLMEFWMLWLIKDVPLEKFINIKVFILNSDDIEWIKNNNFLWSKYYFKWIRENQFIFEQILWKIAVYEDTSHFTNSSKDAIRYWKWRNIDMKSQWLLLFINKEKLLSKWIYICDHTYNDYRLADDKALNKSNDLCLLSKMEIENKELYWEIKQWEYPIQEIIPLDCIDFIVKI